MNLKELTTHEKILEFVAQKLEEQGERCGFFTDDIDSIFLCRYRHGGKKCAIGWIIDDEHYDPRLEGGSVYGTKGVYEAVVESIGWHPNENFLSLMQGLHDRNNIRGIRNLRKEAREYDESERERVEG